MWKKWKESYFVETGNKIGGGSNFNKKKYNLQTIYETIDRAFEKYQFSKETKLDGQSTFTGMVMQKIMVLLDCL